MAVTLTEIRRDQRAHFVIAAALPAPPRAGRRPVRSAPVAAPNEAEARADRRVSVSDRRVSVSDEAQLAEAQLAEALDDVLGGDEGDEAVLDADEGDETDDRPLSRCSHRTAVEVMHAVRARQVDVQKGCDQQHHSRCHIMLSLARPSARPPACPPARPPARPCAHPCARLPACPSAHASACPPTHPSACPPTHPSDRLLDQNLTGASKASVPKRTSHVVYVSIHHCCMRADIKSIRLTYI